MTTTPGRRILITGVSGFLGLRLAKRLETAEGIDQLVGVDAHEPPVPIDGLEFIRADIESPLIARVLESTRIDTLVHTNIQSRPGRLGGRSRMKENNVIGTLQLFAAAQRAQQLTKVVMRSSGAVYGFTPGEPSLIPEEYSNKNVHLTGYGKDVAEAETSARDFGRRRRDVELVILRTQNVVGPTVDTNITEYLRLPVVPTVFGFDPRLQLLHEEDAVEALYRATVTPGQGIFNIAADGVVYLSQAIRRLDRAELPMMLQFAQPTAALLRRLGLVDFPTDQLKMILYGRVLDTRRAKEKLGFEPRYTTEESLADFKEQRLTSTSPHLEGRPSWERGLAEIGASDG